MPTWLLQLLPYLPGVIDSVIKMVEDLIHHKSSLGLDVVNDQNVLSWLILYKQSPEEARNNMVEQAKGL